MKGETSTKLTRRKIAQRNETSKANTVILASLILFVIVLVARAHFLHREVIPGLVITQPESDPAVESILTPILGDDQQAAVIPEINKVLAALALTENNTSHDVHEVVLATVPPIIPTPQSITTTSAIPDPSLSTNLRGTRSTMGRPRIAFAITITKDGSFQDGAAVLAYSIISNSAGRDYDISLLAFVHPNVSTSRPMLKKLGYHVIEAPTPIK
jgi:hypothetical protein